MWLRTVLAGAGVRIVLAACSEAGTAATAAPSPTSPVVAAGPTSAPTPTPTVEFLDRLPSAP